MKCSRVSCRSLRITRSPSPSCRCRQSPHRPRASTRPFRRASKRLRCTPWEKPGAALPSAADMLEDVERFRRNPEIVFHYGEQVDRAYAGTLWDIYGNVQQNAAPQKYNDNYEYEEEYVRSQNSNRASKIIFGNCGCGCIRGCYCGHWLSCKRERANSGSGFLSFLRDFQRPARPPMRLSCRSLSG